MAIVGAGLLVQVMALSVETQRFFFEKGLTDYFSGGSPWSYFKHSALFARASEMLSLIDGPPATAQFFNSSPSADWYTYTTLGPPAQVPRNLSPLWMRNFQIYYLPRPSALWISWIKPALRPVDVQAWVLGVLSIAAAGCLLLYRGLSKASANERSPKVGLTALEAGASSDRGR